MSTVFQLRTGIAVLLLGCLVSPCRRLSVRASTSSQRYRNCKYHRISYATYPTYIVSIVQQNNTYIRLVPRVSMQLYWRCS